MTRGAKLAAALLWALILAMFTIASCYTPYFNPDLGPSRPAVDPPIKMRTVGL